MISRIWHGWTTPGNADTYEALLKAEIFVGIENRHIRGFKGIQLLRRQVAEEVEFVTIMLFDSLDAVRTACTRPADRAAPAKALAVAASLASVGWSFLTERTVPGGPKPPFAPGYDLVGVVDKLGASISDLAVGQTVSRSTQTPVRSAGADRRAAERAGRRDRRT